MATWCVSGRLFDSYDSAPRAGSCQSVPTVSGGGGGDFPPTWGEKTLSKSNFRALVQIPMKTTATTLPSKLSSPLQLSKAFSRFGSLGRLAMGTLCVSLVSFAAVPKTLAAAPNGTYEFRNASGSLKVDGDEFDLPQSLVKRLAGFADGEVTIENNTLTLRRNFTARIVEEVADDLNIDVDVDVSGPSKVVLAKSGSVFTGRTSSPIVASFEGEFFTADFSGELITKVAATVDGRTLTIVVRFSGVVEGEDFTGRVTLTAKR